MNQLSPLAQKVVLSITSIAIPSITALVAFNCLTTVQAAAITGIVTVASNIFHTVWEPAKPVSN